MGMIGNTLAQGLISGANIVDGTVDTPDIKDSAVTNAKIASGVDASKLTSGTLPTARLDTGAAVSNIGYTPVNKAGDTITGVIKVPDNSATFRRSLNDQWVFGLSAPDANDGVEVSVGTQSGGAYNTVSVCSGGKKTIAGDKDGNVTTYGYLQANGGLRSANGTTAYSSPDSAMPTAAASMSYALSNGPSANDGHVIGMSWSSSSIYGAQLWFDTDPTYQTAFRQRSSVGTWNPWSYFLHTNNYKVYTAVASGATTVSGTRGSVSITLNSSTNKILCYASDLVRCTSGYVRGELQLDGVSQENEFMYQQSNTNSWQTTTGVGTLTNVTAGTHTISVYANFGSASGAAWDGPTYLHVIVLDGV